MKTLLITFCLLGITIKGWSEKDQISSYFHVVSYEKNASVATNQCELVIKCKTSDGKTLYNELIKYSVNQNQAKFKPNNKGIAKIKIKPGKSFFNFFYNKKYEEVFTDTMKFEGGYSYQMELYFNEAQSPVMCEKPVIYLYADSTLDVNIQLNPLYGFTFTYPVYNNGWEVTVDKHNGIRQAGKIYNYLFWEGEIRMENNTNYFEKGFIVSKSDLLHFLEEKTSEMGLINTEAQDFITYSYPRMMHNDYTYIHFAFNDAYNKYASIKVNPQPDCMFRFCMFWSKVSSNIEVDPQKIPKIERKGLTLVEWGGAEINWPQN